MRTLRWQFWLLVSFITIAGRPLSASANDDAERAEPPLPETYVSEAPLPEGFPPPSELGVVVEKQYPVIRSYSASGQGAFMKCFGYLSRHQHEMTAPVIMDSATERDATGERGVPLERMHFLLERNSLDEPKEEGPVTVGDIASVRVLSIAHQGPMTSEVYADAKAKLESALAERDDLVSTGSVRVLGYNGPSVRREKQYWEVQLAVEPRDASPDE